MGKGSTEKGEMQKEEKYLKRGKREWFVIFWIEFIRFGVWYLVYVCLCVYIYQKKPFSGKAQVNISHL